MAIRVTEGGLVRVTQDGTTRITEGTSGGAIPRKTEGGTTRLTQGGTTRMLEGGGGDPGGGATFTDVVDTTGTFDTSATTDNKYHPTILDNLITATTAVTAKDKLLVATTVNAFTDAVDAYYPGEDTLDTTILATTTVVVIEIATPTAPEVPKVVTIGTVPPLDVITLFEADVVRVVRWVDIYESDNVTPWRTQVATVEGSVSVDMARDERRNLDITFYDIDDSLPYGPGGFWYDKIIKPYRGIELENGDVWAAPLGEFMPDNIGRPHFPNEITASCRDFVKKLRLDKFPDTTTFAAGLNVGEVIKNICVNGGITKFKFGITSFLLPAATTFERETERWEAANELAKSVGFELFFDAFGYLVFRPFVDPLLAPLSYAFQTGKFGNLVNFTKSTTDTFMFNDVIVYGNSQTNALVNGRATNTNVNSPTRISKIGRRLKYFPNAFVASNAQANEVAAGYLAVSALEQFDMTLDSIVIPWLEAGDAVEVVAPDAAPGDPTRYLLSNFSIPLSLDSMSGTAKRVTIVG